MPKVSSIGVSRYSSSSTASGWKPERISYRDILELFFQIHDPTTNDRQGGDVGSDYRSEIFSTSDEQR